MRRIIIDAFGNESFTYDADTGELKQVPENIEVTQPLEEESVIVVDKDDELVDGVKE